MTAVGGAAKAMPRKRVVNVVGDFTFKPIKREGVKLQAKEKWSASLRGVLALVPGGTSSGPNIWATASSLRTTNTSPSTKVRSSGILGAASPASTLAAVPAG